MPTCCRNGIIRFIKIYENESIKCDFIFTRALRGNFRCKKTDFKVLIIPQHSPSPARQETTWNVL